MPEPKQITFTYQEVAEMMVKSLDISEGLWGLYVNFGIKGANLGSDDSDLRPTAIVPILELGLQRFDKPSNLSVDAAKVTRPSSKKKAAKASA